MIFRFTFKKESAWPLGPLRLSLGPLGTSLGPLGPSLGPPGPSLVVKITRPEGPRAQTNSKYSIMPNPILPSNTTSAGLFDKFCLTRTARDRKTLGITRYFGIYRIRLATPRSSSYTECIWRVYVRVRVHVCVSVSLFMSLSQSLSLSLSLSVSVSVSPFVYVCLCPSVSVLSSIFAHMLCKRSNICRPRLHTYCANEASFVSLAMAL